LVALERDQLDIDEIAQIVHEAEFWQQNWSQRPFDVGFYGFCNDLRRMYKELWQEHLL
jgi:hypothetical protein